MTLKYAGFWLRLIADLIDSTILSAVSWLVEMMLLGAVFWIGVLVKGTGVPHGAFSDSFNPFMLQIINLVVYAAVAAPYYVIGHYRWGTTLGKLPLKIYVVNAGDAKPITLKQSWIRFIGYLVSYLPLGTGYLMAAFHPEKRALHDLMAGTISVRRTKTNQLT
jgi:uncharacterized RDD family membrane protein YckC